ncbi:MAG: hypothetical protein UX39_C0005G0004 [Candidatus Magasanikbacteria bacterium GW2011_GWA2_46_17]|uniref:Uncharacterized protein n=1 Tax=Candidatus Magasanikbacteria bacterium GW2011_GWA2_46_17 TaxID=1619042 RepID=A0A0G1P2J6_9BACT|nr:MAG: hypothetical protein UX39_C0005G0004 [Candidatus Magasanikbacteria bacterium GW2011_GWA2_46_17]
MSFDRDLFHFLFGFLGIISFGLSFLVVVGFYQVEIAATKNLSAPEMRVSSHANTTP